MNVLLTSATGYIGSAIAKALQTNGHLWGDLADALALDQRVSGDRAKHLLNWMPSAPSVLEELTNGSYQPMAITA